jgi:hypothetical protein
MRLPPFREGSQRAIGAGGLALWLTSQQLLPAANGQITVAGQRRTLTGFPPWALRIRATGHHDR